MIYSRENGLGHTIVQRLKVYSQLMRIDKPIGTLLLLWPTLWALWIAAHGPPPLKLLIIFVAGTFLMRSAGCVINDYADRHFDAQVERTRMRPFARQVVSRKEALLLAAGLALLAFTLILPLNRLTLQLSVLAVLIATSYPYTKRFFPVPQAYLGLAFAFGIPMAFAAITDQIPIYAWLMTLATAFWVMAYDTAYAMIDKPDDLKLRLKTSAITFGRYDVAIIFICHMLFIIMMLWAGTLVSMQLPYYIGLLCVVCCIILQYRDIKGRNRGQCFKAFLDNNRVGAIIFAGIFVDYWLR